MAKLIPVIFFKESSDTKNQCAECIFNITKDYTTECEEPDGIDCSNFRGLSGYWVWG